MDLTLTGKEFKAIREACGYSGREVGDYLRSQGLSATIARSVYRLEERDDIPLRYVEALRQLVGTSNFEESLGKIRAAAEASSVTKATGSTARDRARSGKKGGQSDHTGERLDEEQFYRFLNALPTVGNTRAWVTEFRDDLRLLFTDVDRVVININMDCDLDNPGEYSTNMSTTEHVTTDSSTLLISRIADEQMTPSERLLKNFIDQGYPVEQYHPPVSLDCCFQDSAYLGTIFLWREKSSPQISKRTQQAFASLRPFICFALSYIVSRNGHSRPRDRAFGDALTYLVESAKLTEQERRVVTLLLYGHSYEEVSSRIHIAIDTVRKHVKSIYRKTKTHSGAELFAKYFTPRLGF